MILLVSDLFQPVHNLAVEMFLNGDVRLGGGGRSAVPMFFTRRKPDDIAGMNCFNRAALALRESAAGGNNQSPPERMRAPSTELRRSIKSYSPVRPGISPTTAVARDNNAERAVPVGRFG